jgi:serine protease
MIVGRVKRRRFRSSTPSLPERALMPSIIAKYTKLLSAGFALAIFLCVAIVVAPGMARAEVSGGRSAGAYAPEQIVVKYATGVPAALRATIASSAGAESPSALAPHTRLLHLRPGVSVADALARLRRQHDVLWAVPNYEAHDSALPAPTAVPAPAGLPVPNDPGLPGGPPGGWEQLQWNFVGQYGVNALQAWANVAADGAPGGKGVVVAVLDTGVAYANRGSFLRSPDFSQYGFVKGYDFVARNPYPNDHNGHGTFVAGTIAEATNNGIGVTGLAFGARIMPVRVLDGAGEGDASVIAEGVRFAVNHGARVINLSLEFSSDVTADDVPELIEALHYAYHRGVLVVAAAGNEGDDLIPYPARAQNVIAVGATTEHGCLANYSNYGSRVTLVAPGGGTDADIPEDPNCQPNVPGPDIYQETFTGSSPRQFGLPSGYEGTSMATPHVAATAALIIASGVLGADPTPAQITARLIATATKLGGPADSGRYGAGLVNAAAATAPGGPGAVAAGSPG